MPTVPKTKKTKGEIHKLLGTGKSTTNKVEIIVRGAIKIATECVDKNVQACYEAYYEL